MSDPPRVVLDTNVVVSALVFAGPSLLRVRDGWLAGVFTPLASRATAQELLRVLAYPKLRLSASDQEELLADYLPWVEVVRIDGPVPALPPCKDPCDVPFLELAVAGRADLLVSGDGDVLAMSGRMGRCEVLTVEQFCNRLLAG